MLGYNVSDIVRQSSQSSPDAARRIALRCGDRSQTYAELGDRVDALARGLVAAGLRKGDRAAILLHNRIEFLEIFFALARAGAVVVPLNYLLTAPEIAFQCNDSSVRWLFVSASLADQVPQPGSLHDAVTVIGLDGVAAANHDYEAVIAAAPSSVDLEPVEADDLVLLQYTSGTTGPPKGASHTHATVLWNSLHQVSDCTLTRDEVYLSLPALCWAAGLHDFTLATLWLGGTVVVHPSRGFSVEAVVDSLERHGVTLTLMVPSVLQLVVSHENLERRDLSRLRAVFSGSAPVPVALIGKAQRRLPSTQILQGYGMSEFPTLMTVLDAQHAIDKIGSAGRPTLVTAMKIVNPETGRDIPPGTVGEIVVRSPATTIGYLGRDDANARAFAGGWFHTGDLGHLDADGFLYIAGRAKDMIISGGLNVYPAEIEAVIVEHDAVLEVAVLGVDDEERGEVGLAVVVHSGPAPTSDELRQHVRERLAGYKAPKHWVVREQALPRTASGKVAKPILRQNLAELLAHAAQGPSVATGR